MSTLPSGDVTLHWTRPIIPGRHDLYFDVFISSGLYLASTTFNKHNAHPIASDSATVEYTLSGMRPLTYYKVQVSANNGVSDRTDDGGNSRTCEVSLTTQLVCHTKRAIE